MSNFELTSPFLDQFDAKKRPSPVSDVMQSTPVTCRTCCVFSHGFDSNLVTVDFFDIFLIKLALTFYGCSHHCFAFAMMDMAMAMYILSGAS